MFAKLNNFVLYVGWNNAVSHGLEFKRDAVPGKCVFWVSRWIPDLGMELLSVGGDGFYAAGSIARHAGIDFGVFHHFNAMFKSLHIGLIHGLIREGCFSRHAS